MIRTVQHSLLLTAAAALMMGCPKAAETPASKAAPAAQPAKDQANAAKPAAKKLNRIAAAAAAAKASAGLKVNSPAAAAPAAAAPAAAGGPPAVPADVAAAPADAVKTASGLASKVLSAGTGKAHPTRASTVKVHYTGWTTDGKMFDSSVVRRRPATFPLSRVIKGWTEGVQLMVQGEKRRFWIPANLAYEGRSGPQGTLVFDVELLEIVNPQAQ